MPLLIDWLISCCSSPVIYRCFNSFPCILTAFSGYNFIFSLFLVIFSYRLFLLFLIYSFLFPTSLFFLLLSSCIQNLHSLILSMNPAFPPYPSSINAFLPFLFSFNSSFLFLFTKPSPTLPLPLLFYLPLFHWSFLHFPLSTLIFLTFHLHLACLSLVFFFLSLSFFPFCLCFSYFLPQFFLSYSLLASFYSFICGLTFHFLRCYFFFLSFQCPPMISFQLLLLSILQLYLFWDSVV